MKIVVLLLIAISFSCELHSQEIRYIRDSIVVPLRSGQSSQHRIVHKGLLSGAKLTLQETSKNGTYSKVTTEKGVEGWIQTQYLSTEPAGKLMYKQSLVTIGKLERANTLLKKQLQGIQSEHKISQQQLSTLDTTNSELSVELQQIKDISANAVRLNSDNQQLLEVNQQLKNNVDVLSTDNKRLLDDNSSDAFLNGAFAVLIGVMITLLIPRLWPNKNTEWA